jgi:hypothetical protein
MTSSLLSGCPESGCGSPQHELAGVVGLDGMLSNRRRREPGVASAVVLAEASRGNDPEREDDSESNDGGECVKSVTNGLEVDRHGLPLCGVNTVYNYQYATPN